MRQPLARPLTRIAAVTEGDILEGRHRRNGSAEPDAPIALRVPGARLPLWKKWLFAFHLHQTDLGLRFLPDPEKRPDGSLLARRRLRLCLRLGFRLNSWWDLSCLRRRWFPGLGPGLRAGLGLCLPARRSCLSCPGQLCHEVFPPYRQRILLATGHVFQQRFGRKPGERRPGDRRRRSPHSSSFRRSARDRVLPASKKQEE